jgi:hypothetical protein
MVRLLLLIPISVLTIFASVPQKVDNPNLKLLQKVEKVFKFLNKQTFPDRVVYSNVTAQGVFQGFKVEKVIFYTNTPLLVGRAINITSFGNNSTYTAKEADFVLKEGKLISVVQNAEMVDNNTRISFPEIVNTLLWNGNSIFYLGRAPFEYSEDKNTFNDTLTIEAEASLREEKGTLYLELNGETSKLLKIEATLQVKNISPKLLEAIKKAKPKNGKVKYDKKTSELFFSVVPDELRLEIKLKPYVENLILTDKDTPKEIQNIENQLKKVKKGSLEEQILKAALHILKGESNSVVIKIKNKVGINLGQIVGLFFAISVSPNVEQAVKLLSPYFDLKIIDF